MPATGFYDETYDLCGLLDWDLRAWDSVRSAIYCETQTRFESQSPLIAKALYNHRVEIRAETACNPDEATVTVRLYADLNEYLDAIRTIPLEGEEG